MKQIIFHLDFISPYAYLAFEQLPKALKGASYSVVCKPVLFASMLKHYRQLGGAEIAPKRDWTYRQVMWLADRLDVPLLMPASHPFNPLPLLRLALACGAAAGDTNRYVCEVIFRHVWTSGADMADVAHFDELVAKLQPRRDHKGDAVKAYLKANTEAAISRGVFGVPTFEVDDKIFWGLDALPMLRDYLLAEPWFASNAWQAAGEVCVGAIRDKA